MKIKILLLLLLSSVFVSACTHDDSKTDNNDVENVVENQDESEPVDDDTLSSEPKDRIDLAYDDLYQNNIATRTRESFTDLETIFEWNGYAKDIGNAIFPLNHFYSPEADLTFVISAQDLMVAICTGKQDTAVLFDSENCQISPHYVEYFVE